ncbi:unnamed protein product, partial [marine sediment metagenome]
MKVFSLVSINKLKSHEAVNKKHLDVLLGEIKKDGVLKHPVVVDRKTNVILDGHHRVTALKKLGIKKIPVYLVDYMNKEIRVYP